MTTSASMTIHPDHNEVRAVDLTAAHVANGATAGNADLVSLELGTSTGSIDISVLGSLDDLERVVAVIGAKLTQVRFARQLTREECRGGGAHTLSALEHTDLGTVLECTAPGCGGKFVEAGGRLCPVIPDVDGYAPTAVAS